MSQHNPAARVLLLDHVEEQAVGGKAGGLARLIRMRLRVPGGFVVVGASPGRLPVELDEAYRALGGGPVAVRSSATSEDGAESSFAGQYETRLNVEGEEALREAVEACLRSLMSARARAYRSGRAAEQTEQTEQGGCPGEAMAVVVQRMVDAQAAGVLFTVDPVSGGADRVLVDAVAGLGEALVSGRVTPDHYELSRRGDVLRRELQGESPVLSGEQLRLLAGEALAAEDRWGVPLDMEWAIDREGALYWLQARPVTTTGGDLHEFDTPGDPSDVFTRANVGEMMPGALCPLTISTSVYGVDQGIQAMQVACGVRKKRSENFVTVGIFHGQLFFNLTAMTVICRKVAGSSPERLMHAICGRAVPELRCGPPDPVVMRALNGIRYMRYIFSADRRIEELEQKMASFRLEPRGRSAEMYNEIDEKLPFLIETCCVHLQSSATSGFASGVLEGMIAKGKAPTAEHEAAMADMLAGAGGVESAELLSDLECVVEALALHPDLEERALRSSPADALAWLRKPESGRAGEIFSRFLGRHGHRAFRELCMRQQGWADDPTPLVVSLRASLSARLGGGGKKRPAARGGEDSMPARGSLILRWFLGYSRNAVRRREKTKSMLVEVTNRFKHAYRRLAALLAAENLLPDDDCIFFLTHEELGRLVRLRDASISAKAPLRRRVFERQQTLEFPLVFIGAPEPLEAGCGAPQGEETLSGKPVSRGIVEGTARVVRTLEEASALRPGEILIAPVTDVGWTPYFNIIAGLATDVGSVISHGAVVAREYGLPAVVDLKTATRAFKTGDRVILDGDRGILRKIDAGGAMKHGGSACGAPPPDPRKEGDDQCLPGLMS